MAQESANGYCAQQYEVYNACLVLNDYDTITCGESRLLFLNCSKATYENSSSPSASSSLSLSRKTDYKPLPSAPATTSNQALCIHARTSSCRSDRNLWVLRFPRQRRLIQACCLLRQLCHLRRLQVFPQGHQAG